MVAENFRKYGPQVDVDTLDGRYAVLGRFMDRRSNERLETGTVMNDGYRPDNQVMLGVRTRAEKRRSYMDEDGFSGCAYPLGDLNE